MEHVLFSTTLSVTGFELLVSSAIALFGIIFFSGVCALSRLESTIKRKDFSKQPQYHQRTGDLQWAIPTPSYGW